ncbi:MAG: hypothetical protein ACRCYY_10765 [Trueperaceae bacterium]
MTEQDRLKQEQRQTIKKLLDPLTHDELHMVVNMAQRLIQKNHRAFWENPPERYRFDVTFICGHTENLVIAQDDPFKIEITLEELEESLCLKCLSQKIATLTNGQVVWQPQPIVGVSGKQTAFAESIRRRKLHELVAYLENPNTVSHTSSPDFMEFIRLYVDVVNAKLWIDKFRTFVIGQPIP